MYVVRHQVVRHLNIGHGHLCTNKASTTLVMLDRASTTSLVSAQSPIPLSDARVYSKVEVPTQQLGCFGDDSMLNNPCATQREIWCYPAQYSNVVPPRSINDK